MGREYGSIRKRYEIFAQHEAQGVSQIYEQLAYAVAQSDQVIDFLASLPKAKQQPNLLFGAVRAHLGLVEDADRFCAAVVESQDAIRQIMLRRATQTNEPGRCATLLPVLSQLEQPIALLEVGASAGLCLYPDRYAYDYGWHKIAPEAWLGQDDVTTPTFHCAATRNTPLPDRLPRVVWRSGIDLNPLDVADEGDMNWLQNLIWPEQTQRMQNVRLATSVARTEPPNLVSGDLLSDLESTVEAAPPQARVVVFHSAVLAYVVDQAVKEAFVDLVNRLDVTWISNEHPSVFPDIALRMDRPVQQNKFLLAVNGEPVAATGPHGQSIEWFG